jgi:hypothetical protein
MVMRALSTLTFLCVMPAMSQSGEATDQFRPAGQEGTLVDTVPPSDGLVIASDTRSTTYGIACNGNPKIVIPSRPDSLQSRRPGSSKHLAIQIAL